jgi:hypothetical protein
VSGPKDLKNLLAMEYKDRLSIEEEEKENIHNEDEISSEEKFSRLDNG